MRLLTGMAMESRDHSWPGTAGSDPGPEERWGMAALQIALRCLPYLRFSFPACLRGIWLLFCSRENLSWLLAADVCLLYLESTFLWLLLWTLPGELNPQDSWGRAPPESHDKPPSQNSPSAQILGKNHWFLGGHDTILKHFLGKGES